MSSQGGYTGRTLVVIVEQELKIVPNQIMELFFVPHLDIAVPDKALDGNEVFFFIGEIRLFQLVKEPDRSELL